MLVLPILGFGQKFKSTEAPSLVADVKIVPAISRLSLIIEGNKSAFNDSLSFAANIILKKVLEVNTKKVKAVDFLNDGNIDSVQRTKAIIKLFNEILKNKKLDSVKIPEEFNVLYSDSAKYILVVFQRGFTREKGNFGKQVGKSVATGILTLGMAYSSPIKFNSSIYACIVNNEAKKVSFFNNSELQIDPLKHDDVQKQFLKLFEKYFN